MLEEILFGNINKELLTSLVPLGYLIFILYFYGSEKWKKEFSDFDKISFSTVMSFIVLYFLVMPLSWTHIHIYNFFIFSGESNIINPPQAQYIDSYIAYLYAIFIILFMIKMISNGSLYENKKVYAGICLTVIFFLLFFTTLFSFFLMTFYIGGYFEYFTYMGSYIFSSCILLATFLFTYITTHKNYGNPLSFIDSYLSINNTKSYAIMAIIIFLIFSVATGMFLFKPSIVENGEQVTEMYIELLPVSDMPKHKYINAQKTVEQYYVVKTPILIPWVKIETNLTLKSATGEIDGDYNQYYINDNYFIVDNSSKQVNVTVVGTTEDFYLTNELIYLPPEHTFQNETEMVNLTLTNNISADIEIKYIIIHVNENYVLTEDNFIKAQHFANGNGGIGGYEQGGSVLHLHNIHLLENASGTISLILTKQ